MSGVVGRCLAALSQAERAGYPPSRCWLILAPDAYEELKGILAKVTVRPAGLIPAIAPPFPGVPIFTCPSFAPGDVMAMPRAMAAQLYGLGEDEGLRLTP